MGINRAAVTIAASVTAVIALGVGGGVALLNDGSTSHAPRTVQHSAAAPAAAVEPLPASSPASPATSPVAKVSPSKKQAAVRHRKTKRAAVVNQEAPVTDPAPNDPPANDPPANDPPAPAYTPSIDPKAPGLPNMSRPAGQPHPSPSD